MGTRKSTVPNVAYLGEVPVLTDVENNDRKSVRGWKPGDYANVENLYVRPFKGPNAEIVYVVNTHPDAEIGECDWAVFSPEIRHVEAFFKALRRNNIPISPKGTVVQTS